MESDEPAKSSRISPRLSASRCAIPSQRKVAFSAPSLLIQSNHAWSDEFIKLTANPAQGKGGTCFGDSGGPDILSGTNIVLAVNSYVTNSNCAGVTYSQRVDLPDILNFVNSF